MKKLKRFLFAGKFACITLLLHHFCGYNLVIPNAKISIVFKSSILTLYQYFNACSDYSLLKSKSPRKVNY